MPARPPSRSTLTSGPLSGRAITSMYTRAPLPRLFGTGSDTSPTSVSGHAASARAQWDGAPWALNDHLLVGFEQPLLHAGEDELNRVGAAAAADLPQCASPLCGSPGADEVALG